MERLFRGRLKCEGVLSEPFELKLRMLGNEKRRSAHGSVPMSEPLRNYLLFPTSRSFLRFISDDGDEFDLIVGRTNDPFADRVKVESSGKVPGLMD